MNIFVGNLSRETNETTLRSAFESYGSVSSCSIIKDRFTRVSRGFGFVEMPNTEEARLAIEALNGSEIGGRNVNIDEAHPRAKSGEVPRSARRS